MLLHDILPLAGNGGIYAHTHINDIRICGVIYQSSRLRRIEVCKLNLQTFLCDIAWGLGIFSYKCIGDEPMNGIPKCNDGQGSSTP